jgi:hypothetical protein
MTDKMADKKAGKTVNKMGDATKPADPDPDLHLRTRLLAINSHMLDMHNEIEKARALMDGFLPGAVTPEEVRNAVRRSQFVLRRVKYEFGQLMATLCPHPPPPPAEYFRVEFPKRRPGHNKYDDDWKVQDKDLDDPNVCQLLPTCGVRRGPWVEVVC